MQQQIKHHKILKTKKLKNKKQKPKNKTRNYDVEISGIFTVYGVYAYIISGNRILSGEYTIT